ncbi:MAG: hypothetical protein KIT24_04670 [Phycisphaeraceae bacterium]|nr:hypothetical protein [Phycisphaeraceae bacterium]
MSRNKSLVLLAGAALGMASSASLAQSTQDAYRAELISDASSRSSLLASGGSVVHENGSFGFTDATGNNSMYFSIYGTYRHFFNFGDDDRGEDNDFAHGGQLALVQAAVFGTVAAPNMHYFLQVGASGTEGLDDGFDYEFDGLASSGGSSGVSLLDYFFVYDFEGGMYFIAGQGKPLQGFEQNAHENQQQRLNRSLPAEVFGSGRQQFFGIGGNNDSMEWQVFFSDGANTPNTDFFNSSEADIAIGGALNFYITGGREAWHPSGEYGRFFGNHQSAFQGSPEALRAGVAMQYESHGDTGFGTSDFNLWLATVGGEYRNNGFSARLYGYLSHLDPKGGDSSTNIAFSATVGYFVDPNIELYLGWDGFFWDEQLPGTEDNNHFIVAGVNFFPFNNSAAVRFTVEAIYSVDKSSDFFSNASVYGINNTGTASPFNLLGNAGKDGEFGIGIGATIRN